MSRQYSRIERSDEKRPTRAQLRIDIRVQLCGSRYASAHPLLAVDVGLVVGEQQVFVAHQQRVHQRPEELAVAVRERAGRDEVDGLAQLGVGLVDRRAGGIPRPSAAATSSAVSPKRKKFSAPTASRISTLAPSSVPMVSAPFIANFMLPVPEASLPAVEICSERSAAGIDVLAVLDVEVGEEDHLEQRRHAGIAVDHVRDAVDQPDDELGHAVSGGGLAAEDDRAGRAVVAGPALDAVVQP